MNYRRALRSTLMLAIGIATVGNVDNNRKMPPPRVYGALMIVWWILGIVADFSARAARLAAVFSGLLVLTMLTGKMGQRVIAWLQGRAVQFGAPGAAVPSAGIGGTVLPNAPRARPGATSATSATAATRSRPAIGAMPMVRRRTGGRDMSHLTASDRFSNKGIVAAANALGRRIGKIPHAVAQEGTHVDSHGRYAWVKFEDPRGGSDTRKVYY